MEDFPGKKEYKDMTTSLLKRYTVLIIFISIFPLLLTLCTKPDKNLVYGPDNPDPYPANRDVAVLDSIQPVTVYPTEAATIFGAGFYTDAKDKNFVWFDLARAEVIDVMENRIVVEVPVPPNTINPDFLFKDAIDVKISLPGSFDWSNSIPFIFKPMAHVYEVKVYPAQQDESKFTTPRGLAFDTFGNIYLMNQRTRTVFLDNPDKERSIFAFLARFDGGLRTGPDGALYGSGNSANTVYKIPQAGGSFEEWATVPNPWGMDFDDKGNLFVVDEGNGNLYIVSSQAVVEKVAELPGDEKKEYCRIFDDNIYVSANTATSGFFLRLPLTGAGVGSADTVEVGIEGFVKDLTFGLDGSIYFTGVEAGVNGVYKYETSTETLKKLVELSGNLGFLSWFDKFLYISNMTGSDTINDHIYQVLIYDNESAPYHGR